MRSCAACASFLIGGKEINEKNLSNNNLNEECKKIMHSCNIHIVML